MLRGDDQWMLPSVSKKLEANEKLLDKSSRKKKKEKKKSRRKSSGSSSSEEVIKKRKKRKERHSSESSSSSSSKQSEDEWIEKKSSAPDKKPMEREDWLSGMLIPTFSGKEKETKKDDQKLASYDPKTSSRELNPFWKNGGTGMPTFQKPKSDSDDDDRGRSNFNRRRDTSQRSSGWRKRRDDHHHSPKRSKSRERTKVRSNSRDRSENQSRMKERSRKRSNSREKRRRNSHSRERSSENTVRRSRRSKSRTPETKRSSGSPKSDNEPTNDQQNDPKLNRTDFLTDQQMNELGAKILKAEILGNDELAGSLKEKLEKAREYRTANKSEILRRAKAAKADASKSEEHVMLTKTNNRGITKPLSRQTNENDLWGGRAGRKKNKKVETHVGGERVRYFADDDKYDIKQMVSCTTLVLPCECESINFVHFYFSV